MKKNIFIVDPYPKKIEEILRRIFGENDTLNFVFYDNLSIPSKIDLFFMSAMMVIDKGFDLLEIKKEYGNKNSKIIITFIQRGQLQKKQIRCKFDYSVSKLNLYGKIDEKIKNNLLTL